MSARAPVRLSGAQTVVPGINKKFLHFLESVPDAMILSDQKGRIVMANDNIERMFGYSRDELVGKEIEILVPEGVRTRHREDRATYYANRSLRRMGGGRELSARRKDGVEIPVEISLGPVEIRGKTLVWSAIHDIADRERSIAQIREAMREKRVVLGGWVSVCAWCKRVCDEGAWLPLERYVASHLEVEFTHGICKECLGTLAPARGEPSAHSSVSEQSPAELATEIEEAQREMVLARERYKTAEEQFSVLTSQARDIGLNHPDGAAAMRVASKGLGATLGQYQAAVVRLANLLSEARQGVTVDGGHPARHRRAH
jgi:PAS domain S-box-containing protein